MTTRTIVGPLAIINYAYGWDPNGNPVNGDTLDVPSGNAVMFGGSMPATTVVLGDPSFNAQRPTPELDLLGHTRLGTVDFEAGPSAVNATINVFGHATIGDINLGVSYPGGLLTINIAPGSTLAETITSSTTRSTVDINGGAVKNTGDSVFLSGTVAADVIGKGEWTVGGSYPPGRLTFLNSVGHGQTVNMTASAGLTIGDPADFHATVNIEQGWAETPLATVLLSGMHGDSFTYKNDLLSIKSGNTVVDRLHLTEAPGMAFSVSDTAAGITIANDLFNGPQQTAGVIPHTS
jgi:hypothetical protein